jgi:tRNA(Leu) C34 or U34 (ribose-2'-O)-methylase TrmL
MGERKRGICCIGLDHPKNALNVGSALRAAAVYGADLLAVSGERIRRLNSIPTDTMKAIRTIPLIRCADLFDALPFGCVPVAVDLIEGAESLVEYKHPKSAFYIFGGEDATLGDRILSRCRDVVYVPTSGCMNLAATVNVVLYDRMAKAGR